jgi:hypothetical protein
VAPRLRHGGVTVASRRRHGGASSPNSASAPAPARVRWPRPARPADPGAARATGGDRAAPSRGLGRPDGPAAGRRWPQCRSGSSSGCAARLCCSAGRADVCVCACACACASVRAFVRARARARVLYSVCVNVCVRSTRPATRRSLAAEAADQVRDGHRRLRTKPPAAGPPPPPAAAAGRCRARTAAASASTGAAPRRRRHRRRRRPPLRRPAAAAGSPSTRRRQARATWESDPAAAALRVVGQPHRRGAESQTTGHGVRTTRTAGSAAPGPSESPHAGAMPSPRGPGLRVCPRRCTVSHSELFSVSGLHRARASPQTRTSARRPP